MNVHRSDIGMLGRRLGEVYAASPRGEKVTALHLFGIVHADDMADLSGAELDEIVVIAGLSPRFVTELRKMIKLSRHVMAREGNETGNTAPTVFERLARPLPPGYKFDREEANAR